MVDALTECPRPMCPARKVSDVPYLGQFIPWTILPLDHAPLTDVSRLWTTSRRDQQQASTLVSCIPGFVHTVLQTYPINVEKHDPVDLFTYSQCTEFLPHNGFKLTSSRIASQLDASLSLGRLLYSAPLSLWYSTWAWFSREVMSAMASESANDVRSCECYTARQNDMIM